MGIIQVTDLTKKFGDFIANNKINLDVKDQEIKCIVGENGAGKSTLMNMLYGLLQPTSGKILIHGKEVVMNSPIDAIANGIGMVHQHFKLVPSITVYENILLGAEIQGSKWKRFFIDQKEEIKRVEKLIKEFNFDLNPMDKIEDISVGGRQRVEILKMLYRNVDILILDEPTAVLTPQEVDELMVNLKQLKKQGKTIIVITHKLREVMELSDSITVIKHGKVIGNVLTKDTNEKELAQMMVGRDVVLTVENNRKEHTNDEIVYKVDKLTTVNEYGKEVVKDISFEVRKGEVLGIAGVEGNGQSELVKLMTGLMCSTNGKVTLQNKDITNKWPKELRKSGIGIVPEDRYAQGLCKDMNISENCIAGCHDEKDICHNGFFDYKKINEKRDEFVKKFDIRIGDINGNVSSLSGGNAQKIIIARELSIKPKLLIACQPTRGVDIGSIEFIHKQILNFRDEGNAVILVSSELSEVLSLSDRVVVMYKGKIVGEVDPKNVSTEAIGLLMAGIQNCEKEGERV
ncbi:ABC transporter ATP-binding protein [Clostridium botulinum]|uniref:ABC transporter ATP-binding protein n=1 Tax=Clostridium botulinum TaxID=1491 RepID=A0A0C2S566_CLOBO|nr:MULTISPECIES: ABC transporter ATP-binding protein [Clostridium]ACD51989.1 ribose import ATP-binding protein RbsA [Clostridium botulinum E3 str. Alaska E43]AJF31029.1 ABC transporter ATP-binding protein [Clostridium botulinum]AJF34091.1 ABC transporter ATP-binding protein [Clostridium botulinum]EES47735.1 ribose import ATP-binding protein RbsA [Clostridium botulinum E1 str. 'BoNT E Beluga']KAI3350165.1 ABC transporter ATP-binding protein [Clostridium botulinum]